MASDTVGRLGPVPTPLPAPPSSDFWSDASWDVLLALMEAACPSIVSDKVTGDPHGQVRLSSGQYEALYETIRATMADAPSQEDFDAYLANSPVRSAVFVREVTRTMASLPIGSRKPLGLLLRLLSTRLGTFLMTGRFAPVQDLSVQSREDILKQWRVSKFPVARVLFKMTVSLTSWMVQRTDPLFLRLSGYPAVVDDQPAAPGYPFRFVKFPIPRGNDTSCVVTTDVVIVGSGCGGAVCAKVLAEAGHEVLVLDKSYHYPPSCFPMAQEAATHSLFESEGLIPSDDMSINVLAGSCWGGGGTVNWGVSFQTQDFVRKEWAEKDGLDFFAADGYQHCMDRVCDFMGVSAEGIRHNHRNLALLDGSRKLGWDVRPTPVNSDGRDHFCGHCHCGCPSQGKRGTTVTWLPAAATAGAKFAEGFRVEKILMENSEEGKQIAVGVEGVWTSRNSDGSVSGPAEKRIKRRVVIKAKKIIVSGGTLWSPILLMKSGIKNRQLGRNLHLHPCNFVVGYYDEHVKPWEGGIITSCAFDFENLDGAGHGTKLETMSAVPYSILANMPWRGGLEKKIDCLRLSHMAPFLAVTRDRDTGRVYPDPHTGQVRIEYTPSAFDQANTLQGVVALAKLCYVTGAKEIHVCSPEVKPFFRTQEAVQEETSGEGNGVGGATVKDPESTDVAFADWLAGVRRAGNKPPYGSWGSGHQMGTCRMSSSATKGVVDRHGRVWGARNLFVADGSVLPSACGVNPMVTIMSIADWIAREGIDKELRQEKDCVKTTA